MLSISLPYSGKMSIEKDNIMIKATNKLPLGLFSLELGVTIEPGRYGSSNQPNPEQIYYLIKPDLFSLIIDDKEILYSNNAYFIIPLGNIKKIMKWAIPANYLSLHVDFKIDADTLNYIESKRSDDINLTFRFYGEIFPILNYLSNSDIIKIRDPDTIKRDLSDRIFMVDITHKLSAKEWIKFLEDLGHSEKWIIEFDRPKLENFHEVIDHIEKAKDALYNKSDPEDVIRDLRAARDSFKPFYDAYKNKIMELIDRGSIGQKPEHKNKSERIDDIYGKISYLLDIGPHSDKYKVTYQDALLAYREFVSILSYFSEMIEILRKEELEKIVKNEHPGHP